MNPSNNPSSRRQFMKSSTAALTGAALASQIASRSYAQSDGTIRMGLVGCGGRGTGAATQALSTEGPVKLVAMADAFQNNLDRQLGQLQKEKGDKVEVTDGDKYVGFDAYKKVIDRDDIDLVILATSPGWRPIHFEYAVAKGKNVFMEKPVATDAHGIRRVLAAAEEAKKKNLKIGVGLQRHHDVRYQEIIKRIHDGAIGDIVALRCYWSDAGVWTRPREQGQTEMQYQMRNWYYFNWLCGDHITEQHIHNLDVCNWLMGAYPSTAQGMGGRQVRTSKEHGQIYDHHFVEFVYGDKWDTGTHMFSQCRHIKDCYNTVSEHAHGSKGYAMLNGFRIYDEKGELVWRYKGRAENPYQKEHDDLFEAIRKDLPYNEAENGAKSTMTSIFGRMATYSGKMLRWDDAIASNVDVFQHDPKFDWTWDAQPPVLPNAEGYYPVPMPGETTVI